MPNIKSAAKRMKTSLKSRERNRSVKSSLRTLQRKLNESIGTESREVCETKLRGYYSALDKAVKQGVIMKNTADRSKQRAARRVNAAPATSTPRSA